MRFVRFFTAAHFVDELKKHFPGQGYQAVLFLFPHRDKIVYSAVKIFLLTLGVPSQVILARNVRKFTRDVNHVAPSYVALQIYTKLGGIPWVISESQTNEKFFVIGISENTEESEYCKTKAVAVVACLTGNSNGFKCLSGGYATFEEMSNLSCAYLREVALARLSVSPPSCVSRVYIFISVGVQGVLLDTLCLQYTNVLQSVFRKQNPKRVSPPEVIIASVSRSKSRYAAVIDKTCRNPKPGTVCQRGFRSPQRWRDFDLVSHGTTFTGPALHPTSYKVISGPQPLGFVLPEIAFQHCHLYFNYCGSITIPAVLKYSYKLANLTAEIGQSFNDLSNVLYFI